MRTDGPGRANEASQRNWAIITARTVAEKLLHALA
jgi:hypothetical protein